MTNVKYWDPLKKSEGERRLVRYLRICDYAIWLGLASTVSGWGWPNTKILGLGVSLVTISATVKLAGVLVAFHVMSSRQRNEAIAPWIRRWTRIASMFIALLALFVFIAVSDIGARVGAALAIWWSVRLFRRAGPMTIADLGAGWGGPEGGEILAKGGNIFGGGVLSWGPELDALLTGAWLVGAIVARLIVPDAFNKPPHNVTQYDLKTRVQRAYYAEQRFYQANRRYSSDITEIRPLTMPLIDSLVPVSITVDTHGYRAVARHPYDSTSCGLWGGSALTALKIEGAAEGQPICWTGEGPR